MAESQSGADVLQTSDDVRGDDRPRLEKQSVPTWFVPSAGRFAVRTERLLFVEPDVAVRAPLAEYLRGCGYGVIEANSMEDAQEILWEIDSNVDVVLAEVSHLGSSEAFSLAKYIREHHPGVDVILSSSAARCADKAEELCHAEGMLGKPYHSEGLLRRIRALRERRRSSDAAFISS